MFISVVEKEHYTKQIREGKMTDKDTLVLLFEYLYCLENSIDEVKEQIGNLSQHLGA
jgi:hypothetical protein